METRSSDVRLPHPQIMHLSPALQTTTTLHLSPSSPTKSLQFICTDPPASPQLWTNFSTSWRAVPFKESRTQAGFWTAEVALAELGEGTHEFEYTYRLVRTGGAIEWLGTVAQNGRVVVRVSAERYLGGDEVKARLVEFELEGNGEQQFELDDVPEVREFVSSGASQGLTLERSE